jgi:hypothetical protein
MPQRPFSHSPRVRADPGFIMLLLLSPTALLAQSSLRITSPADATTVHPGESLKVTVEVSPPGGQTRVILGGGGLGLFPGVGSPPYQFEVPIPKTLAPGPEVLTAMGWPTNTSTPVYSNQITILVERADEPARLTAFPPTISLQPRGRISLQVTGVFANGERVDLKLSSRTMYSSDTPRVVTVEPNSVVTALAPGTAKITVSNGKAKVEVPVVVSAPNPK